MTLYHKGGRIGKALDLSFKYKLYQQLSNITEDLDQHADPALLERAAKFFNENNQKDKAVGLLIVARKFEDAIDMCYTQKITLTEEMAEKMTLPKVEEGGTDDDYRNHILEKIGDCCNAQESFALATKKYTQAGNRVKAMKCLMKDGDTEKIAHFAKRCGQKDIYIMAANFLQTKDWRHDPDLMDKIITFYTKARASENLATFYDACAQVEIDEYQNYNKALDALTEALKTMSKSKSKDSDKQDAIIAALQQRYLLIEKFVCTHSSRAISRLQVHQGQRADGRPRPDLSGPQSARRARRGVRSARRRHIRPHRRVSQPVYICMHVAYTTRRLVAVEDYKQAYAMMQELRERIPNVNVSFYVGIKTIEAVHRALDIPLGTGRGGADEDAIDDETE